MIESPPAAKMENEKTHSDEGKPSEETRKVSRAILFRVLSILWIFPSFGAGWILAGDFKRWFRSDSVASAISLVKVEEWVAFLLLLLQAIFIFLAIRFRTRVQR